MASRGELLELESSRAPLFDTRKNALRYFFPILDHLQSKNGPVRPWGYGSLIPRPVARRKGRAKWSQPPSARVYIKNRMKK